MSHEYNYNYKKSVEYQCYRWLWLTFNDLARWAGRQMIKKGTKK